MRRSLLSFCAALLAALPLLGQSTSIAASHIAGDVSGRLLAAGKFCVTPVDATGHPSAFTEGGTQYLPVQSCYPVAAGALSGVALPDTALATPAIGYKLIIESSSGLPLYSYAQPIYPTGASWSLDTWAPAQSAAVVTPPLTYSVLSPVGNCAAPAIWYTSTQVYTCVGQAWSVLVSGGGGSMVYPGAGLAVSTGLAWGASLTAPASAIVGVNDTQALLNKTLDGVTPATMAFLDVTSSIQAQLNAKQAAFASQAANLVFASPNGAAGVPGFRALVAADIPALAYLPSSTVLPSSAAAVAHQWVASYNATTGAFTLSQPAFTDLSGSIAAAQLPAFTGDATTAAGSTAVTVKGINGTLLSSLGTGILKNTTSTGVPSIAAAADFPLLNQSTTGNAATATALAAAPALCATGQAPTGILANGNATGCASLASSGMTNPMTALGQIIYGGTSGTPTALNGNSAANSAVLTSTGNGTAAAAPAWNNAPALSAANMSSFPTLNQNTTGTAANVTGAVAIANGGTGATTQQAAINALTGTQSAAKYLRSDGTNSTLAAIVAADVPTLNQSTTGTAANVTGIVAVANGGTGTATPALVAGANISITGSWPDQTIAASAASGLTNPMTTLGDIITGGTSGAAQRLGVGATGQVLTVVSGAPAWAAASGGGGASPGGTIDTTGAITMTAAQQVVIVKLTTPAAVTITLPASPTQWQVYHIKDGAGNAATYTIAITPSSGTIDGATSYRMTNNYEAVGLVFDGTNWSVL